MKNLERIKGLVYAIIFCMSLFLIGCNPTTTVDTNTENAGDNTGDVADNNNSANKNENSEANESDESSASVVEAKEPDTYQGKVKLSLEAMGDSKASMPAIEAFVARDGANKRMEFNLPNSQKIVYLEINGKNLVILPEKKQYAELTKDAVGMEVRSMMTPEQIVKRAKTIKGLEKVGEEKYEGRDAVKYKYSATTKTNTKAGKIDTESSLFVDKETGLPLKTEIVSESKDSSVQGFSGLKIVTEMSEIKTEVSEDLFKEPEGFEKIDEKQIRDQLNLVFNVAGQFLKQMLQNANGGN